MARTIVEIRTDIAHLKESERLSKQLVGQLAVECCDFLHTHGQVGVLNELLIVLSPANRKAVTAFFKEFSGFSYKKDEESFGGKRKPVHDKAGNVVKDDYADCKINFTKFVDEGNSFWLWYNALGKKDTPESKPLDLAKLSDTVKKAAEKAEKQGVAKLALFNAIITDVFSPEDILDMLTMADAQAKKDAV